MSEFYKEIKFLDLFQLFDKIQDNIFFINDLQKFDLVTPLCVQNEQAILKFYLAEKWLDEFPKQSQILKFIEDEQKLFYLPDSPEHYFLYFHLLKACKNYFRIFGCLKIKFRVNLEHLSLILQENQFILI